MNTQFWLLFLFGVLVIGSVLAWWRSLRDKARRSRVDRALVKFVEPRLMELRRSQAPLYGDRKLVVRGRVPDKVEPRSEQAEAYDRWQVSDVCDYRKLPGYRSYETVNEPSKHDNEIRERINELKARRRRGA